MVLTLSSEKMLNRLRTLVSNEQRLVWSKLLQWMNIIFIAVVIIQIGMAVGIATAIFRVLPFLNGHDPHVLPSLLAVSGILTLGLCILGYYGSWYSSSVNVEERFASIKYLMTYELLACIAAILALALSITCFTIVHGDILWASERGIKKSMEAYSNNAEIKYKLDTLQMKFKCCGISGFRDWFAIPWQKYTSRGTDVIENSVPWSCCAPESDIPCIHMLLTEAKAHKAYSYPGCSEAIVTYLGHGMYSVTGGVMIVISFILFGMAAWMRLLETGLSNAFVSGDPESTALAYVFINYGPHDDVIYDELDQDGSDGWESDSDEDDEDDDDVNISNTDELDDDSGTVIAVSSVKDLTSQSTQNDTSAVTDDTGNSVSSSLPPPRPPTPPKSAVKSSVPIPPPPPLPFQ